MSAAERLDVKEGEGLVALEELHGGDLAWRGISGSFIRGRVEVRYP